MNPKVSWSNVSAFLALTFGLDWLLALFIYLKGGLTLGPSILILLQLYMLFPAFSVILLQLFVFKESPFYFKTYQEPPRYFLYFFFLYTLLYCMLAVAFTVNPALLQQSISYLPLALTIGGLLCIVFLQLRSGTDSFVRARLSFGSPKYFVYYGLLFVILYSGMTLLNILFNLGKFVDVEQIIATLNNPGTTELTPTAFLVVAGIQDVLLGPFIALLLAFGEEYGWRGYLQNELTKMGRIRGVLVVGLIWGVWHAPIIAMGYNYPGYPILGIFLMTLYTIELAFILGLAYFQSKSVWLVAFLHGLNNQVNSFLVTLIYQPNNMVFSFGVGIYGLLVLGIVVILLLRHSTWKESPEETKNQ
jgi:membrane protease YdiL (CAAX protease family)